MGGGGHQVVSNAGANASIPGQNVSNHVIIQKYGMS